MSAGVRFGVKGFIMGMPSLRQPPGREGVSWSVKWGAAARGFWSAFWSYKSFILMLESVQYMNTFLNTVLNIHASYHVHSILHPAAPSGFSELRLTQALVPCAGRHSATAGLDASQPT